MTIRSNVNLRALNTDFTYFLDACEAAPEGVFEEAKNIRDRVLGYSADELLRVCKSNDIGACNCDGIREVEIIMFDMVRRMNPDSQIESAIGFGREITQFPNARERVIAGLIRDRDFVRSFNVQEGPSVELLEDIIAMSEQKDTDHGC